MNVLEIVLIAINALLSLTLMQFGFILNAMRGDINCLRSFVQDHISNYAIHVTGKG